MTGHSAHDDAGYVPPGHFEEWKEKDPIDKLIQVLKKEKLINDEELKKMDEEIEQLVLDASDWAEEQPHPAPEEALEDVYYNEESKWWELKTQIFQEQKRLKKEYNV